MRRRSPEHMAVVHLGRAMASLDRSGLTEDHIEFIRARRKVGEASDALIDALERLSTDSGMTADNDPALDEYRDTIAFLRENAVELGLADRKPADSEEAER